MLSEYGRFQIWILSFWCACWVLWKDPLPHDWCPPSYSYIKLVCSKFSLSLFIFLAKDCASCGLLHILYLVEHCTRGRERTERMFFARNLTATSQEEKSRNFMERSMNCGSLPWKTVYLRNVQFSSVIQSCLTVCGPMNCSKPGLPVHHQLPEFTETHVHWVGDAIQPSYTLSSPSSPALNLSQHQGLFKQVSSFYQVAKLLELQLQHQSFQWTPRTDLL